MYGVIFCRSHQQTNRRQEMSIDGLSIMRLETFINLYNFFRKRAALYFIILHLNDNNDSTNALFYDRISKINSNSRIAEKQPASGQMSATTCQIYTQSTCKFTKH